MLLYNLLALSTTTTTTISYSGAECTFDKLKFEWLLCEQWTVQRCRFVALRAASCLSQLASAFRIQDHWAAAGSLNSDFANHFEEKYSQFVLVMFKPGTGIKTRSVIFRTHDRSVLCVCICLLGSNLMLAVMTGVNTATNTTQSSLSSACFSNPQSLFGNFIIQLRKLCAFCCLLTWQAGV